MTTILSTDNLPDLSSEQANDLSSKLDILLEQDYQGNLFAMLAQYQKILADNQQRHLWPQVHEKLELLFVCGTAAVLDGPMIGIPVSIRDSDYFKSTAKLFGRNRSIIAEIEWMATAWNATFADTGLWMGKTFEPVSREIVAQKTAHDVQALSAYTQDNTRIGRNFFRDPANPNTIQALGIPALTQLWNLQDRPMNPDTPGFDCQLTRENLEKETRIPYSKTGGIFLADVGHSVLPSLKEKSVYQLNYRWPSLGPVYPMTRLIDEIVQIGDGIYLGQLVLATKHYSLGTLRMPVVSDDMQVQLGEAYKPGSHNNALFKRIFGSHYHNNKYYGYQNNGYFLMMDPNFAEQVYADDAFPQLRPRPGENGYTELGYDKSQATQSQNATAVPSAYHIPPARKPEYDIEWIEGWKHNPRLLKKFTSFITEPSPKESDPNDFQQWLRGGESILQMLQLISRDISAQTKSEDQLRYFEKLNRLFRSGVAPAIKDGLFKGSGERGYNHRLNGEQSNDWYGEKEKCTGLDYYHGATLNLHLGFSDSFCPDPDLNTQDDQIFPSILADAFDNKAIRGPNLLNMTWHNIGKYIFPWAGKSFEKISPRKLSMLLDESDDLSRRYPDRVKELQTHLASAPHYDLVKKNQQHYWKKPGQFGEYFKNGSWDKGMTTQDKQFWTEEAKQHWVFGNNLQDKRILSIDALMRIADMNYRTPEPAILDHVLAGPSPFARIGYIFLGVSDRNSILPMNNGAGKNKKVFQFHYRYPMIGGPAPIGYCLDELVEIADGLFLGQLIYSTALSTPFHSSVSPSDYKYQLFGYFLLLDDEWEYHRQAIKLDTVGTYD